MSEITPGEDKGLPNEQTNPIRDAVNRQRSTPGAGNRDARQNDRSGDEIEKLDPVVEEENPPIKTEVGRIDEGGDRVPPGQERNVA